MTNRGSKRRNVAIALAVGLVLVAVVAQAQSPLPPLAVRTGSIPYYSAVEEWYLYPEGRPDLEGGCAYYSRWQEEPRISGGVYDCPVAYWVKGSVNMSRAQPFIERRALDGSGFSITYFTLNTTEEFRVPFYAQGAWRHAVGLYVGPGAPPDSWIYITRFEYADGTFIYFETPNWTGGSYNTIDWDGSETQVPVPPGPSVPNRPNPGGAPTVTYPSLPDPGSTPAPGPLPPIGDIAPLPDIPLDNIPNPPPSPEPPDPVPETDPVSEVDPVPEGDPIPTPDPVPEVDPVPEADPVPEGDPIPTPDPVPEVDPVPEADPVPEGDPIPTPDPIPEVDPLPTTDAIPEGG